MKKKIVEYDEYIKKFRILLKSLGIKYSLQRELVLKVLFKAHFHMSAQEITDNINEMSDEKISQATVYKILNFLKELKIIRSIELKEKRSKVYELNIESHHDHLVCTKCGKMIEFFDEKLENIQKKIVKQEGYSLQDHNMIIYGICKECQ